MKICIPANEAEFNSNVADRFARAPVIIVIDTETRDIVKLESAAGQSHGAGLKAAQSVLEAGATIVLSPEVGPKAMDVLKAGEIEVFLVKGGTVAEALERHEKGELERVN